VIRWGPAECETIVPPGIAADLLNRAIAIDPDNPILFARRAELHLDRFDFAGAAAALETALRLDPSAPEVRARLGRCYNVLGRPRDAFPLLAGVEDDSARFERAAALLALGRSAEAEAEYGALLAAEPGHHHACWKLCRLLRHGGRVAESRALCEALFARGVRHAQLFYDWGLALALTGDEAGARALLFDPSRVTEQALPVPEGFSDIAAFNAALADDILTNPHAIDDFPTGEEANRGSARVHHLLAWRRPELVRLLLASLQQRVDAVAEAVAGAGDPWSEARPAAAHLRAWGLIQRDGDHEDWHTHRGGWLSGVYYVGVPAAVSAEGAGPGCIEFGPQRALEREKPGFIPVWRHAPRPGRLLLAPSHYPHRTIPTGVPAHRISLAFDVVPDRWPVESSARPSPRSR